jgi:dihydrofolate reductase
VGKLVVNTFTSLDGVMQSPGMPEEDREGGFDQGGWQVPYFDEESGQVMTEAIAAFDALLLGRKTYEIFAGYWPYAPADDPIAVRLNEAPKYVASRTIDGVGWNNSTLLTGDIADEEIRPDPHFRKWQPGAKPDAGRPGRPVQPVDLPRTAG